VGLVDFFTPAVGRLREDHAIVTPHRFAVRIVMIPIILDYSPKCIKMIPVGNGADQQDRIGVITLNSTGSSRGEVTTAP
jgi:hypothetical protein